MIFPLACQVVDGSGPDYRDIGRILRESFAPIRRAIGNTFPVTGTSEPFANHVLLNGRRLPSKVGKYQFFRWFHEMGDLSLSLE